MPRLRQVCIDLHVERLPRRAYARIYQDAAKDLIDPFSILRSVEITLNGDTDLDPEYVLQLKAKVQGLTPVDPLMKMCYALEDCVNLPSTDGVLLEIAYSAMYDGDMGAFKRARTKLVKLGNMHGDVDRCHLYEHDPKDGSRR